MPQQLHDAGAVFDQPDAASPAPATLKFPPSGDIDATLRRAAREGGTIAPKIEERMRRDREAAQRELDQTEHGEDKH